MPSVNVSAGGHEKNLIEIFNQGKQQATTDAHRLVCLGFSHARAVLPGDGGDPLGVVSGKDARAEGGSSSGPVLSRLLALWTCLGVGECEGEGGRVGEKSRKKRQGGET